MAEGAVSGAATMKDHYGFKLRLPLLAGTLYLAIDARSECGFIAVDSRSRPSSFLFENTHSSLRLSNRNGGVRGQETFHVRARGVWTRFTLAVARSVVLGIMMISLVFATILYRG